MSDSMDTPKDLKRKIFSADNDERSSQSERKRKKKDGKGTSGSAARPKHYPLSERQQLALLMQMTAEENNEQAPTPPPAPKKAPGGSGRKDKVNKRNERGETPLHIATIRGELPLIMDLVKQGADVNVQDYAGWTPLHEACNHGFLDIARFLLDAGAIVNSKGFNDDYPLHDAVINEYTDLVELLLKHGANPLLSNKQGERPLDSTKHEEIKRLMENEILLSDDSDRSDSKADEKEIDNTRSEKNKKSSKVSTSSFSRELFKQFDDETFSKISSSSDSDDSDNLPLSRRRTISTQSKSSSSSNQTVDRKTSTSGYFESKRSKNENKRRLFSTESSESVDSEAKPPRPPQPPDFESLKPALSSEDESCSHSVKSREERLSSDSQFATEKKPTASAKRSSFSVSNSKSGEADVYDFSPNADDFSNENNAISLKAESKTSNKRDNKGKQPGLFSRKTSGLFSSSKGYESGAKKARKPSKETSDSATDESIAVIKPVHETSEMLFDRIFKSPQKEDDILTFEPKPNVFTQKSLTSSASTSASTRSPAADSFSSIVGFSGISKSETEKLFSTDKLSSSSLSGGGFFESANTSQKSLRHSDIQSNIFNDVFEKEFNTRSMSIDNASIIPRNENRSTTVPDENELSSAKTSTRTLSLDSKEKTKKNAEDIKIQKSEFVENKPVKKIKTEIKDKASKTVSGSLKKSQTKSSTKDVKPVLGASKKLIPTKPKPTSTSLAKKEQKADKKLTLIPESKSIFLSDLEKTSSQRHQEKLRRKKLVQKKVKPTTSLAKSDEKKTVKKTEVKLMDSWLGSVPDIIQVEKQRKAVPRSTKKLSDPVSESDKMLTSSSTLADSDSAKARPSITPQGAAVALPKPTGSISSLLDLPSEIDPGKTRTFSSDSAGVSPQPPSALDAEETPLPSSIPSNISAIETHSSPTKIPPADVATLDAPDLSILTTDPTLPIVPTTVPEAELAVQDDSITMQDPNNDTVNEATLQDTSPEAQDTPEDDGCEDKADIDEVPDLIESAAVEEKTIEKEPSEQEKMLQLYIQERLAANKVELSHVQPLRDRIPMHVLMSRKKDPAVDKLNVIEERLAIQRRMFERRKKIASVIPQAPQHYWEYITLTGGYLLSGSVESRLSVPVLAPPPSLCQPMVELFKSHEEKRVRLRVQHAIQREKLIISCEQEIMRVHSRAARTNQNQQTPFSACAMLMDCEVYTMPRQTNEGETGKTSIRDRFNARMFLSWIQDVDDKYGKIKSALLTRQRHEAEALHAVQKTEWILKCQEIDRSHRALKPEEINEIYVPMVNIADDFVLLPA